MEFKHSPAPWVAVINTDLDLPGGLIKSGDKSIAHTLQKAIGAEQARANAHLIAAAPELLEALIEMQRNGRKQGWDNKYESSMEKTRLAIAKALGQQ
ncbi:hypothetical protein NI531_00020 [Proteus penneri]|uniref:hypothetical protein n=1 Tax=Proteus penneri TaxID=102862 RepID=UPI002096E80A|nr:hypothetical protein [Proteus penneri]MCO8049124.1 hypothetical protein [Proteus penneri]